MLIERMRKALSAGTGFIEPCLPSPAAKPPAGSNWIHEIKHDGFWLMARRDPGIRSGLARLLFFGRGQVPPPFRSFEELFLDKGIYCPFRALFALPCLGAVLFCFGVHGRRPVR
jgi:hypothetical protein